MPRMTEVLNEGTGNLEAFWKGVAGGQQKIFSKIRKRFLEIIEEEFDKQGTIWGEWQELKEITITLKGNSVALFETGDLKNSFQGYKIDKNTVWIGSEHKLAAIHEFGTWIKVSDKMRRFMAARGIFIKKETTHIRIPERPIFRPALEQLMKEFKDIIVNQMNASINIKPV